MESSLSELLSRLSNPNQPVLTSNIQISKQVLDDARRDYNRQQPPTPFVQGYSIPTRAPVLNGRKMEMEDIIQKMAREQDLLELNILETRKLLEKEIARAEHLEQAADIIGKTVDHGRLRRANNALLKYDEDIHLQMKTLQTRQQTVLEAEGIPCFRASTDPRDIRDQIWFLAPFISNSNASAAFQEGD